VSFVVFPVRLVLHSIQILVAHLAILDIIFKEIHVLLLAILRHLQMILLKAVLSVQIIALLAQVKVVILA
jgi:hypothetical protein